MPRWIFDPCCPEHAALTLEKDGDLCKRVGHAMRICEMPTLEARQAYMAERYRTHPEFHQELVAMVKHVWERKRPVGDDV